jgi:hypothetical protein
VLKASLEGLVGRMRVSGGVWLSTPPFLSGTLYGSLGPKNFATKKTDWVLVYFPLDTLSGGVYVSVSRERLMPGLDRLTLDCIEAANAASLTPAARTVLLLLCAYSDRRGGSFPTAVTLARQAGVTDRTVRKAFRELETCGVLIVEQRPGRTNHYVLVPKTALSRLHALPELEPPVPIRDPGDWEAGFKKFS